MYVFEIKILNKFDYIIINNIQMVYLIVYSMHAYDIILQFFVIAEYNLENKCINWISIVQIQ